ncbi:MAG: hypothetical protein FJ275_14520 [Planctomycetes bacterium]|nr:hypothetical protein [Planctomycetota bacterium]
MLAADDVFVGLAGQQVVLGLDPAGTAITNLHTSYNAGSGVLTIKAASAGVLATALLPSSGITVDPAAHTIAVNLKKLPGFTGISVAGNAGTDTVTVGPGGIDLSAVAKGAAAQSFIIDTGAGALDTISIANKVVAKGAGGVSLTTLGSGVGRGVVLEADVTTPKGGQTFAGAVMLPKAASLKAGGPILFASTLDGLGRLTLSAGDAITMAAAVGSNVPLGGIVINAAKGVAVNDALTLDGTGTPQGTSGFVVGANVNNVVFSPATATNVRTIRGFGGNGFHFAGSSTGSVITNLTSIANRKGLKFSPGASGQSHLLRAAQVLR